MIFSKLKEFTVLFWERRFGFWGALPAVGRIRVGADFSQLAVEGGIAQLSASREEIKEGLNQT
jgi:hypothetical protein